MTSPSEKGNKQDYDNLARNGTESTLSKEHASGGGGKQYGALNFAAHTASPAKVLEALNVADSTRGLSDEEAARRLEQYGPNRLKPPPKPSLFKICMRQVANAMTLVLSEYRTVWSGFVPGVASLPEPTATHQK